MSTSAITLHRFSAALCRTKMADQKFITEIARFAMTFASCATVLQQGAVPAVLILAHNHPSGVAGPGHADRFLTSGERLIHKADQLLAQMHQELAASLRNVEDVTRNDQGSLTVAVGFSGTQRHGNAPDPAYNLWYQYLGLGRPARTIS